MGGWCCCPRRIEEESVTSPRKEKVVIWDPLLKPATVRPLSSVRTELKEVWDSSHDPVILRPYRVPTSQITVWQPVRNFAANRDVGGMKENKNDQKLLPKFLASGQQTEKELVNINRKREIEEELRPLHHSFSRSGHNSSLEEDFNRLIAEKNVEIKELPRIRHIALCQGPWGRGNAKEQLSYLFHLCGTTDLRSMYVHSPTIDSAVPFRKMAGMGEWIHRWKKEFTKEDDTGLEDGLAFAKRLFVDLNKDFTSDKVTKEEFVETASSYDDIVAIVTRRARRRSYGETSPSQSATSAEAPKF